MKSGSDDTLHPDIQKTANHHTKIYLAASAHDFLSSINVWHDPHRVNSVTAEVHFLWGPCSLVLFTLGSLLHSSPSPIRGVPAVYQ